jgi:hypothetical protein
MSGVAVRQACRRLAILCLGAILLYIAVAAVASIFPAVEQVEGARFWPVFLPDWPIAMFLVLTGAFFVCDVLLWALSRASARREREGLQALASGWRQRADAKMAEASGDQDLRLGAFRAQVQAGGATLRWTAPASTYDRVLVLRSRETFALAAVTAKGQAVAYEGEETGFVDQGLEPGRVYFYTAFAEARGAGQWSPPAWAWVTTPPERLRDVALHRLWTLRH